MIHPSKRLTSVNQAVPKCLAISGDAVTTEEDRESNLSALPEDDESTAEEIQIVLQERDPYLFLNTVHSYLLQNIWWN